MKDQQTNLIEELEMNCKDEKTNIFIVQFDLFYFAGKGISSKEKFFNLSVIQ